MRRPARPSAAVVIASLALAAALASPAYSLTSQLGTKLAKNSVGSPQIKDKSVRAADLAKDSVKTSKIGPGQVRHADLANGAVDFSKIADGTVGRAELANGSVDGGKILDGSVALVDLASPVRSGSWSFLPTTDAPVAQDATIALGSLGANGGGPITVGQTNRLVISGQVYATPIQTDVTPFKGRLVCTVAVDGTALLPASWMRADQNDEETIPLAATAVVAAGAHDVSLSCRNPTNAAVTVNVGRVLVNVLAVPQ